MKITIHIGASPVRLFHLRLIERLSLRPGLEIAVVTSPAVTRRIRSTDLLFRFEAFLHALARPGLASRMDPVRLSHFPGGFTQTPGVVLDFEGTIPSGANVWALTFDGVPGEAGLLAAALAARAPVAALTRNGEVIAIGRLGTERNGIALAAFEDYLARVITFIEAALDGAASRSLPSTEWAGEAMAIAPSNARRAAEKAVTSLARTIMRRLYDTIYQTPHWRVGWRRIEGPGTAALRRHPAGAWRDLPDDRRRFFADPFPHEHAGAVTLFVEEFDHRRQKGIISAIPFGPHGPAGPAEPVLDLPYHLSYPFVFERDGEIWMIPESCAARSIDLYRATDYPRGWVRHARLVDGIVASDATIVEHQGRWWMFATVHDGGGAYSDTLYLWSAPDFRGPWTPHRRNPVLIDVASARPAGRIVECDGALIRPVQDCRLGYGNALGLARILQLDDEGFEQVVEATLHAGPAWPGRRLHTLNSAGGLEFIDGSGQARRPLRDMLDFGPKPNNAGALGKPWRSAQGSGLWNRAYRKL